MSVNRKKLLFISMNLENGGAERSLVNLLQMLDYEKYDIDLLLFKECGMFFEQIPERVNLRSDCERLHILYGNKKDIGLWAKHPYLNIYSTLGTVLSKFNSCSGYQKGQYRWKWFYTKKIPKLLGKYDVAVSYLEGESMYYLVDKVDAKKKIAWIHNDYISLDANVQEDRPYFDQIDRVVSISTACVEILKKVFPEKSADIYELPNLISSKTIYSMADKGYPNEFEEEKIKIVSIGRLSEQKRFDRAVKATAELKKSGLKFQWIVLGEGELRGSLEKLCEKYSVSENIRFIGARENPYPYLRHADVVVQTSDFEGKSIVLDEAKILGKPIVVTNYETVNDQIENEYEGLIVEMKPEKIAKGILSVLERKEKFTQYLLSKEYGNEAKIVNYCRLFDDL